MSKNRFKPLRLLECCAFSTSTSKVPFFSFLTDFGEPAKDTSTFSITNGDNFESGCSEFKDSMIRKRAKGPVGSKSAGSFSTSLRVRFFCLVLHDLYYKLHHLRLPPTSESNKGDMASRAEYPALHVRATQMIYSGHAN